MVAGVDNFSSIPANPLPRHSTFGMESARALEDYTGSYTVTRGTRVPDAGRWSDDDDALDGTTRVERHGRHRRAGQRQRSVGGPSMHRSLSLSGTRRSQDAGSLLDAGGRGQGDDGNAPGGSEGAREYGGLHGRHRQAGQRQRSVGSRLMHRGLRLRGTMRSQAAGSSPGLKAGWEVGLWRRVDDGGVDSGLFHLNPLSLPSRVCHSMKVCVTDALRGVSRTLQWVQAARSPCGRNGQHGS